MDSNHNKSIECILYMQVRQRRRVIDEDLKKYVKKVTVREDSLNDCICNNCHIKYYRWSKQEANQNRQPVPDTQENNTVQQTIKIPKSIKLNINTASKSHK